MIGSVTHRFRRLPVEAWVLLPVRWWVVFRFLQVRRELVRAGATERQARFPAIAKVVPAAPCDAALAHAWIDDYLSRNPD